MKRYIAAYILALAALLSCEREQLPSRPYPDGDGIFLYINASGPRTKSADYDDEEIEPYNEMLIKTIDWFIYPEGGTNSNAVLRGRWSADAGNRVNKEQLVPVTVNESDLNTMVFPGSNNTCQAYAIVNYPGTIPGTDTSIPALKALAISADFAGSVKQESFVMEGQQQITLSSRKATKAAYGTINVKRVAAKLTLSLSVVDTVKIPVYLKDEDGNYVYQTDAQGHTVLDENGDSIRVIASYEKWTPIRSGLKAYLVNAVDNAKICADADSVQPHFFSYGSRSPKTSRQETKDGEEITWYDFEPYYSYPHKWVYGASDEPYIKVELPWSNGTRQKQFYYRIMTPGNYANRNEWYHLNVDIAILGSETDNVRVNLDSGYHVVDWNELVITKESKILDVRYITVPQETYYMYNIEEMTFPFSSSHDCSITINSVTYRDFKNFTTADVTSTAISENWVSLSGSRTVKISHPLDNDMNSSSMDVSPYTINFTIRHSDEEGEAYYRNVTVIQYPAIYIVDNKSNGYVYLKGTVGPASGSTNAQVYDDSGTSNYTSAIGTITIRSNVDGSSDNTNQYQYNIHVTVLDDPDIVIADPRGSATSLSNINGLSDYRPAAEDTQNAIAPIIKIASSYGKTAPLTYENAVKHCAVYQENGYPAGRWRLPTKSEINFLVNLSENNKIPSLFSPSASNLYWAAGQLGYGANGFVDLSSATYQSTNITGGGTGAVAYVGSTRYAVYTRCVYDVWYWGDGQHQMTSWNGYKTDYDSTYDE